MKQRAPNNRTITLTEEERREYAGRCLRLDGAAPAQAKALAPGDLTDKIICGDLFDAASRLPGAFADLLIADPPYNLSKNYGAGTFKKASPAAYADFTRRWLAAVLPVLKPDASLYICCDWQSGLIIAPVLAEFATVRNRITWQREKGRGARRNWKNAMEDIWFATLSDDYTFHGEAVMQRRQVLAPYREEGRPKDWEETPAGRFRDTCASNFWDDISIPYWSMPENTDHPAQKPEKLLAKLILAGTGPGGLVFDPFLGSGSSAVAAKKLGRRYLGVEREEEYCALAEKRLALAEADPAIQGYSHGVFWERNTLAAQKRLDRRDGPVRPPEEDEE